MPSLAVSCLLLAGCGIFKSSTPQSAAYTSLAAIGNAVNAADYSYTLLVVSHQVATNSVPQVSQYFNTFQQVFGLAVVAAENNLTSPAPANVLMAGTNVLNSITAAKGGLP